MDQYQSSSFATIYGHGQLPVQIFPITEAANMTWDFLCGTHEWIQKSFIELQESKIMWFLQDDIEVPCIMQCCFAHHPLWRRARAEVSILGNTEVDDDTLHATVEVTA